MRHPILSIAAVLAVSMSACTAPGEGAEYSWKKTPPTQLDASTGVDLGVSARGHVPARIALVCDRQKAVRFVLRSKLPSTVTDYLPERDVLYLSFGKDWQGADLKPSFAFSTVRDGALSSSVSDPLDPASRERMSMELARAPRQLLAFGISESAFRFEIGLTKDALDRFLDACRNDAGNTGTPGRR